MVFARLVKKWMGRHTKAKQEYVSLEEAIESLKSLANPENHPNISSMVLTKKHGFEDKTPELFQASQASDLVEQLKNHFTPNNKENYSLCTHTAYKDGTGHEEHFIDISLIKHEEIILDELPSLLSLELPDNTIREATLNFYFAPKQPVSINEKNKGGGINKVLPFILFMPALNFNLEFNSRNGAEIHALAEKITSARDDMHEVRVENYPVARIYLAERYMFNPLDEQTHEYKKISAVFFDNVPFSTDFPLPLRIISGPEDFLVLRAEKNNGLKEIYAFDGLTGKPQPPSRAYTEFQGKTDTLNVDQRVIKKSNEAYKLLMKKLEKPKRPVYKTAD